MSVTRAIEHIGDRASNIREYIIYLVKGRNVRHTRVDRHAEG
jgi:phosphate transport system protein